MNNDPDGVLPPETEHSSIQLDNTLKLTPAVESKSQQLSQDESAIPETEHRSIQFDNTLELTPAVESKSQQLSQNESAIPETEHSSIQFDNTLELTPAVESKSQQLSQDESAMPAQHPVAPHIPGYLLVHPIGQGTYAQVWKALQLHTQKWVAFKIFTRQGDFRWQFSQTELERLIRLAKNPYIVSVFDAELTGNSPYIVMELMSEGSLEKFVKPDSPALLVQAVQWMSEVCQALIHVHAKGLIHCDLKPGNIMLDEEGHVRVADFGQARLTVGGVGALGTFFYMAPEQAVISKHNTHVQPDIKWDVYGWGASLYALLTGAAPYDTVSNRERLEGCKNLEEALTMYRDILAHSSLELEKNKIMDRDITAIIGKCLQPEEHRYATIASVIEDLRARAEKRPVTPRAAQKFYRLKRFLQRNASMVAVAGLAVLALLGAYLYMKNEDKKQLARSYVMRAQQFSQTGDDNAAIVYYAESNRIYPSHLAGTNVSALLNRFSSPKFIIEGLADILTTAFSHDGKLIFTGCANKTGYFWDALTGHSLVIEKILQLEDLVRLATFSPDDAFLATVGSDKAVKLWDVKLGKFTGKALLHEDNIQTMAFSPDGKTILTGCRDGSVSLWNVSSGQTLWNVKVHQRSVGALAFSSNGQYAVTGSDDETALIWNVEHGQLSGVSLLHAGEVKAVAFSPDGSHVLTGCYDNTARVWDVRNGLPVGRVMGHEGLIWKTVFSPDGSKIATASSDQTARLWDAQTGEPLGKIMTHNGFVWDVLFSPDGKALLTLSSDKTAQLWNAATGKPVGKIMLHNGEVRQAAFSSNGKSILTVSLDKKIRSWDVPSAQESYRVVEHKRMQCAVFNLSKNLIVTGGQDGLIKFLNMENGQAMGTELHHNTGLTALALSADGTLFAAADSDQAIRFGDVTSAQFSGKAARCEGEVLALKFSPDGRFLLSGDSEGKARIWNVQTGEQVGHSLEHGGKVLDVAYSPDGQFILTGSMDKKARLWSARSQELWGKALETEGWVYSVVFSPNGKLAMTGSADKTVRLWNVQTSAPVGKVMRQEGQVKTVAFSPEGQTLLAGGLDKTINIWDVESNDIIGKTIKTEGSVDSVTFTREGAVMAASSSDGTVTLYPEPWLGQSHSPQELLLKTFVSCGYKIDAYGFLEALAVDDWTGLAQELAKQERMK